MDFSWLVMWLGFFLAAYTVVGNDVIQTLGTFLTSNEKRIKWQILWAYAAAILVFALTMGYLNNDIDYGRLDKFNLPEVYHWYFLLPPLVLLVITRWGIPVSTTFMVLTLFSLHSVPSDIPSMVNSVFDTQTKLGGMIQKSIMGYVIAFMSAIFIYVLISRLTEKHFINNPLKASHEIPWTCAQWATTGFLWYQWLTQDLANIYVYLRAGEHLGWFGFIVSLLTFVGLLGYVIYRRGGKVQKVVRSKTNTDDIRAATFIDLFYGIVLYIFKYDYFGLWGGKLPMSTTWVFIGLLAGREIGVQLMLKGRLRNKVVTKIFSDLGKVFFGLLVSVCLVFLIKVIAG